VTRRWLRLGLAVGLVLGSAWLLARFLHAKSPYSGNHITERYAEVMKTRGFDAAKLFAHDTLTSLLGSKMPDLTLSKADGSTFALSSLRGSSLALLWANTGCPAVDDLLADLSSKEWKWHGYDRFIVLLRSGRPIHCAVLPDKNSVAYVRWPFPERLGCVSMTPSMLFVDPSGRFVGFKLGFDGAVFLDASR